MPFGQHLDPAVVRGMPRSALIAGIAGLALLVAPPLATAQDRVQNPGGDKNITAQVQKQPTVALPSLNPLVERVFDPVGGLAQSTQTVIYGSGERESRTFSVRVYTATELLAMLGRAGYVDCRCYGGIEGGPFGVDTRLAVVARRPG